MTRKRIEEIIDKFRDGEIAHAIDFKDLIEACYDIVQDVDDSTIKNVAGSIHVNIDGTSLAINSETGKLEARGVAGPVGLEGDKGPTGDKGSPLLLATTYPTMTALEDDFSNHTTRRGQLVAVLKDNIEDLEHGNIYIRGNERYEYLNNIKGVEGVKGETGAKGNKGPKGEPGDKGDDGIDAQNALLIDNLNSESTKDTVTARVVKVLNDNLIAHTLTTTSKTEFGHARIGNGMNVVDGEASVVEKDYLFCSVVGSSKTFSSNNSNLVISKILGRGINNNDSTGQFTLKGGKIYRVTFSATMYFAGSGDVYITLGLYNTSSSSFVGHGGVWVPVNRNSMEASCGPLETIVNPSADTNYFIRSSTMHGTARIDPRQCSLIIQEL